MPQIGWLEILSVVIIAILVLGPKEFPIALKKIGSYIGKAKNTLSGFQKEVSSVTKDVDLEEKISSTDKKTQKNTKKNCWKTQVDLKLTADSYTSTTNFTTGQTLPFTYSGSVETTAENYLGKVFLVVVDEEDLDLESNDSLRIIIIQCNALHFKKVKLLKTLEIFN